MKRTELKSRIVCHTVDMIRAKGINSLTVDEISTGMGISKRTFYEVFSSKAVLIEECVMRIALEYKDNINRLLENKAKTPLECLVALTNDFISFLYSGEGVLYLESRYHGYNIFKIKKKISFFWTTCFRSALGGCKDLLETPLTIDDMTELYMDYLKSLRHSVDSETEACKVVYIFMRGILNIKGINELDCIRKDEIT